MADLNYKKLKEYKGHKMVFDLSENSRLKGFIAIHNDNLGPTLGGTRIAKYSSVEDALVDALKLSEAMTYKCALAGLPFGGGKAVIIEDPKIPRQEMLKEYAEQVNMLNGKFYTGEDVGLEEHDVQYMLKFSPYFIGKTGQAGDPSYFAALSVFDSIKVAIGYLRKNDMVSGKTFGLKGVGKTGAFLAKLLAFAGAKVLVHDLDKKKVKKITAVNKNIIEGTANMEEADIDVFCPCALGNDITKNNVKKIKTKIICGTANNQLESREISDELFKRNILHVPDYIANAGGLLDVADELLPGGYSRKRVLKSIEDLKKTLLVVLQRSKREMRSPMRVADEFAERIFLKKKAHAHVLQVKD